MAKCPNCGYKLKLWNVSQFCPECKVNMRFHNFEEEFYREAKKAELEQAAFHVKVRRLKAAFVGSKLQIIRLVVCLLPVVTLLLPAGNFHLAMPFKSADFSLGLLGVVNILMGSDLGFILGMKNSVFAGSEFAAVANSLIVYALVAVFALGALIATLLCFINIKNMQKIICGFCAGGILASIATLITVYINTAALKDSLMITGTAGFGLYLSVVAFGAVFAVNFIINKKGVPVTYDEGMEERVAIYQKLKTGELNIDDLPQPVVETEETRKIDEQIRLEEEKIEKGAQSK